MAETESVGNIHKRLCAVYGSCAVDRGTVGRWAQRVKASGSGETELQNQQLAIQLTVSNGSAMEIIDALG